MRGPVVCLGYLQAEGTIDQATNEFRWLATGDVGTFDVRGIA